MASIPFTLAALATSAVPGLEVTAVCEDASDPDFAGALLETDLGTLRVRVPRTQSSEVRQSAEILGLAAFSAGSRSVLPFAVPEVLGMTRAGETRAVVSTTLPGAHFRAEDLQEDAALISGLVKSIAAIHDLPASVAQQGGLPVRSSRDLRLRAARLVDRAAATRLLPGPVQHQWERVLETAEIWDFAPTMVHGSLDADHILVAEDSVVGLDGWAEFSVGDPASDLSWLVTAGSEVLDAAVPRYGKLRGAGSLPALRTRAQLYRELEIARWLLHGVEAHDQDVIDDAVAMLDRFVDRLATSAPVGAAEPLGTDEVEAMLEDIPDVVDHLSETAAYESLDEDRMFGVEPAFTEEKPSTTEGDDADGAPETDAALGSVSAGETGALDQDSGWADQVTEPISDENLPRS